MLLSYRKGLFVGQILYVVYNGTQVREKWRSMYKFRITWGRTRGCEIIALTHETCLHSSDPLLQFYTFDTCKRRIGETFPGLYPRWELGGSVVTVCTEL